MASPGCVDHKDNILPDLPGRQLELLDRQWRFKGKHGLRDDDRLWQHCPASQHWIPPHKWEDGLKYGGGYRVLDIPSAIDGFLCLTSRRYSGTMRLQMALVSSAAACALSLIHISEPTRLGM